MSDPVPSQPKAASRAAQAAGVVAAAFVPYLPYTRVLSSESNRRLMFYTREDAWALFALIAATTVVLAAAWVALSRVPGRAGKGLRRLAIAGAIALALLNFGSLYHPIGGDFGYATNYLVLGLLTLAIAAWGRTYKVFAGLAGVGGRFVALAPLVFLAFLLAADEHPPATNPAPPHEPTIGGPHGPVYFFLFDGMDAGIAIREPEGRENAPNLHAFMQHATYFENATSPAHFTEASVPSFLFQTAGTYKIEDGVYYYLNNGQRTPTGAMPTLFDRLDTGKTFKVVGGWYLDYETLLGGRVDWLRTSSYTKPFTASFTESMQVAAVLSTEYGFVPLLRGGLGVHDFSFHPHLQNTRQMHSHALEVIRDHGDDVVAFFHYPVPHAPYLFGRDGPLPHGQVMAAEDPVAYRHNLQFADALLGDLVHAARQAGRWDDATIVVMSDHGLGNTNCVLVSKLPNQSAPVTVKEPLGTAEFLGWLAQNGHARVR